MATLSIMLKEGAGRLELQTSQQAATRVYNRYINFLKLGEQPVHKFLLDGVDAGSLALDFKDVVAMKLTGD